MDPAMQAAVVGALATLLAAVLGVAGTLAVQHWLSTRHEKARARTDIYFRLLALNDWYFWVASATMRGETPQRKHLDACWKEAWQIADMLRRSDSVEHVDEILAILFDHTIPTASERADRLGGVIDAYGQLVNPAYAAAISRISKKNISALATGKEATGYPPGATRIPGVDFPIEDQAA
jgi:hypothetical protein